MPTLNQPSGSWERIRTKLLGKTGSPRRAPAAARRRALADRLQSAYGISHEEAEKEIADWEFTIRSARLEKRRIY